MKEKARTYNYTISTASDLKLNSQPQSQFQKAEPRSQSVPSNPLVQNLQQ